MGLEICNAIATIGHQKIVSGVDLSVHDGERVGLIGASGSGKSTIAMSIVGLASSHVHISGSAKLEGTELIGLSDQEIADIRGRAVGVIFQDPLQSLIPVFTVERQIEEALRRHYSLSARERHQRVQDMMTKVGLDKNIMTAYPHQLSGGQAQRVAIATALITSPRLIIADEPTTALDAITQAEIIKLLVSLVDDCGASLLFITHDFSVLSRATSRCYVLGNGSNGDSTVVESGPTQKILNNPQAADTQKLVHAAQQLTLPASSINCGSDNNSGSGNGRGNDVRLV